MYFQHLTLGDFKTAKEDEEQFRKNLQSFATKERADYQKTLQPGDITIDLGSVSDELEH